MGQALYRKYRSKSLSEIVGQEHITKTLEQALKSGRISHAYLFSGPRGVGKTSIARILAHEVNGWPYTDDSAELDIIETDAASNRGIDEIRDLRSKVYIAPTSGTYKVYIIDEVHMLTPQAFNALLKTLEEPPAHVVFILATTEAHKLPETIISRTQHYTFKPVKHSKVVKHLRYIAETENIAISDEALELIADHGGGSFRDSIGLLDQARSMSNSVSLEEIRQLLGIAPDEAIDSLINNLGQGSASSVLTTLENLYAQGLQAASITSQIAAKLRGSLAAGKPLLPPLQLLNLMKKLIEIPASHNPERYLEILLMETACSSPSAPVLAPQEMTMSPSAPTAAPIKSPPPRSPAKEPKPDISKAPTKPATPAPQETQDVVAVESKHKLALSDAIWPQVLDSIKKQHNTLYGVLRMAQPIFGDGTVELQFSFAFHQKRLNEAKNRQIISDFIKQITGTDISIICTVNKDAKPHSVTAREPAAATTPVAPAALDAISNIFGGGELLK